MTATVVCTHPAEACSTLKSGDIRCTRCQTTIPAPTTEPRKLVCTSEPPEAKLPGPVALVVERASAAGWSPEVVDGNGGIEITVRFTRGNERGHATWEINGEGAWRFSGCMIGGRKYGAREIAARLREPAPEAAPLVPPAVVPAGVELRNAALTRDTHSAAYAPPAQLATVTPIRPEVAAQLAPAPPTAPAPSGGVMPTGTVASFMAAASTARPAVVSSNSEWGERYAGELRQIITWHGRHSARNLQVHLGPSELGVMCDRQVVGKFAGIPPTNHVADPWASIVGTAVHAWLAEAFRAENARVGIRWVAEHKVEPHPDHAGTADLYDGAEQAVVDWKNLSADKIDKLRANGPSVQYQIQLLLYGLGYRRLGLPVRRVVLVALPRTKSSLDSMYVWDHELTARDDQIIEEVFKLTETRRQLAAEVVAGRPLLSIDARPDSDTCYFCPFYRPDVAERGGIGCPGK